MSGARVAMARWDFKAEEAGNILTDDLYYQVASMNMLTVKIPDELHAALQAASRARGLSKSTVVREALEKSLSIQAQQPVAAERWVTQWRGCLSPVAGTRKAGGAPAEVVDHRLAHLLAKHLR